jgi:DNA-binding MarR family transcriptional regulator
MSTISITNRNNSYKEIIKDLGLKQQQVFNCLKESGNLSSEDIKEILKLRDKCSVTGRLKELEERCLITAVGSRVSKLKKLITIVS